MLSPFSEGCKGEFFQLPAITFGDIYGCMYLLQNQRISFKRPGKGTLS